MSDILTNPPASPADAATVPAWPDSSRSAAFHAWLARVAPPHGLHAGSLRMASADASFRRYFRIDAEGGARIIMDAPPQHENCAPFVHVARLMNAAGLRVPQVLEWDEAHGFMLLTDLGAHTMMSALDPARPDAARPLFLAALNPLLQWQQASRPSQLPPYDAALLQRELALFPDWYLARHKGVAVEGALRQTLGDTFALIVARNLSAPQVHVHRDFMSRNLMLGEPLGVLDFQDAVHGPITYDIASLMRDAFIGWDEEFVLDITVRYWERARKTGLLDFEDWHSDFGAFWRAVEWMGLQRHLKVAGIFARITLRDGKPKYLADAPRFIAYIRHTAARYRELTPLLRLLDQVEGTTAATGYAFGRVA
jgi:aminoglycoside/choline kinase family phosphotransferase